MELKQFITDNRISQRELSEILGCTPTNVSNIISGKRKLTGLHVRLLIERFGYSAIAQYADASELPPCPSVNIDMTKTEISGTNHAPINTGDGTQITTDSTLVQVMKQQSDQISKLLEQQERLIALLEKK